MHNQTKPNFLFFMFTLLVCLNSFFLGNSAAQVGNETVVTTAGSEYTFETIDVAGVDFLALTASSDFEDYAGYTKRAGDEKEVAFTLIDGVFETYDFPGSQKTHFYALGNNLQAAGHYQDSDGLYHGVILKDGELRQYDFPNAVQTEIYGISDETGVLTGNYIDDSGVRRGFSGDTIVEFPGASATYADFVNAAGVMVGSYIDADGLFQTYTRVPDGTIITINLLDTANLEYFFMHGINNVLAFVARAKPVGGVPRTYVGSLQHLQQEEFKIPGSVWTQGWNINQDSSIVGHYESADSRIHGFIARPVREPEPIVPPAGSEYTFESIDVGGVDFLALTASSDFEDYAGYTKRAGDEKEVAFTLIDGVFETYDFPGSQKTHFYALGNNLQAAGHYQDSDGLYHGVILKDGELRQYDFPNAVQTEIYGISDETGVLTGNYIDDSGVRRGFSGDTIVEFPGASATYAEFVNSVGVIVGSYIDADGLFHPYSLTPDGYVPVDLLRAPDLEYFFVHGVNDALTFVLRVKLLGDVPRTYVVSLQHGIHELQFPDSVSTEGRNINQDGSVVGYYHSADGRVHGFIARPVIEDVSEPSDIDDDPSASIFNVTLAKGLNMISVPLAPSAPMTARTLAKMTDATTVITLDTATQQFVGWTPAAPDDGFTIEGGKGYIINVSEAHEVAFVGSAWTNQTKDAPAAPAVSQETWAFVVSGHLAGRPAFDGYQVIVRNQRTDSTITASVRGDYFAAVTADLSRRGVVEVGDVIEVRVISPGGTVESDTFSYQVTPEDLADAVLFIRLDGIGSPKRTQLLQNYPNPFNPETWIPYHLTHDAAVQLTIYDTKGELVRQFDLGHQLAGYYTDRTKAAYWNGRNQFGETVGSGLYFYQLQAGDYSQTRKLVILK